MSETGNRAGIGVQGGVHRRLDSDTADIFDRQADFIQRSGNRDGDGGIVAGASRHPAELSACAARKACWPSSGDNADGSTNIVPLMAEEPLRQAIADCFMQSMHPGRFYSAGTLVPAAISGCRVRPELPPPGESRRSFRGRLSSGRPRKQRFHFWKLVGGPCFIGRRSCRPPCASPSAGTISARFAKCRRRNACPVLETMPRRRHPRVPDGLPFGE